MAGLGHPEGAWSRAAAPSGRKEPVEVVPAPDQDASWVHRFGGFPPGCRSRPRLSDYYHLARERLRIPQDEVLPTPDKWDEDLKNLLF